MDGFDHMFADQDSGLDTMFADQEDGSLIDVVSGFDEAGNCVTDCPEFSENHQTSDDATPDDLKDEVGGEDTDNAPSGAEGTDSDPDIDLAAGEGASGGEFSCSGDPGVSDADEFYDSPDGAGTTPGEGPEQNPDPARIDDMMEAVMGEGGCGDCKQPKEGAEVVDDPEGDDISIDDIEEPVGESADEYEEGDADLIDMVSGEE